MPVSMDGLLAGFVRRERNFSEKNWREDDEGGEDNVPLLDTWSRAGLSDCCRRWADSTGKDGLRVKCRTLGGAEARSGAIKKGLEAVSWHCFSFNKIRPCFLSFSKLFILGILHSQLMERGAKEMEKLNHQRLCHLSKIKRKSTVMSELTGHRVVRLPAHGFGTQMVRCPPFHLRHAVPDTGLSDQTQGFTLLNGLTLLSRLTSLRI